MPFIQERKKLGGNKLVCQFCSQIVNDQQIALIQIRISFPQFVSILIVKGIL